MISRLIKTAKTSSSKFKHAAAIGTKHDLYVFSTNGNGLFDHAEALVIKRSNQGERSRWKKVAKVV